MRSALIAGTHSGCGKTTVTLGILAALCRRGFRVQAFKTGPDFIDGGLHALITGNPSRNLDLWMCGEEYVRGSFARYGSDADISIVEGVMGLYDGVFSTASLAATLRIPVVLVVDAYGMAESAGAVVSGFVNYRMRNRDVRIEDREKDWAGPEIAGVILNRVASENHYLRLRKSIRDVPVLGYLPRHVDFGIPHRHLGLAVAEENPLSRETIERLAETVLNNIDLDWLAKDPECGGQGIGKGREGASLTGVPSKTDRPIRPAEGRAILPSLAGRDREGFDEAASSQAARNKTSAAAAGVCIAVAYDKAFCFYYADNLDLLRGAGAKIVTFSPLADTTIPECADALYIGGGYPELYPEDLSKNRSMRDSIRMWADSGRPLYAECGGLMYLSRGIHDFNGGFFEMAGVLPFSTAMKKSRARLGYREISLRQDCIAGKEGMTLRGHEFHYSEILQAKHPAIPGAGPIADHEKIDGYPVKVYRVKDNNGQVLPDEGYRYRNALASYLHLHLGSNPAAAEAFVHFVRMTRDEKLPAAL